MRKRAQAAMEFLMTYGWALLVVLIAISALAFFGILNPGKFLPSNCNLGVGLACVDFKIDDDMDLSSLTLQSGIDIIIQNGLGKSLDIFIVYIDQSNIQCGGWAGAVALKPLDLGYGGANAIFADSETKRLRMRSKNVLVLDGIRCYNTDPFSSSVTSCCSDSTFFTNNINYAPPLQDGCDVGYICQPTGLLLGSKFKADLVVIYREVGSSLIHSRVGQLVAQVE